jgi:hypothetical protein
MHANGGHDRLDGLRLNACIAWKSCQRKIWTGLSSTDPWPSATCTGHAGSSFLGHVNTYHHTSPCALSWCSACMSKTLVHVATHKLGCCWLIDRSEVCQLCAGDRMQRLRLCVFQRTSVCSMDLLGQPCMSVLGAVQLYRVHVYLQRKVMYLTRWQRTCGSCMQRLIWLERIEQENGHARAILFIPQGHPRQKISECQ